MCESEPGIVVEQAHRHHQVPGNRLRVAFVQAQQVPPHGGVEIGRLHFLRQIGFLRTRRAAFQGTVPTGTGPLAAPATVLRRVAARPAILAIRSRMPAIVFAALETGVTAPPRVTTLIGITTTLEPTALARLTTPGIAPVTGIVTATVESTALARLTTPGIAPVTGIVTATVESTALARLTTPGIASITGIVTATVESTALARLTTPGIASITGIVTATVEPTAGIAAIEPAAGTGVTARTGSAPRIVAALAGVTPAFEAAAVAGILIALESASLPGPASASGTATACGLLPALETTALGCVAPATEATGVTTPVAGLLTFEPTALARTAALVVTAAVAAAVEPGGIVAALETTPVGGTFPSTGTTRFPAARRVASLTGIASTVEATAASATVLLVTSPAGPGVRSAAPEGLPIVVLVRHGAPFLGFAKSRYTHKFNHVPAVGRGARQGSSELVGCSNADRGPRIWVPYRKECSGGVLLSHTLSSAVPSALAGLASGFGMGPGVSLPLWPP